VAGAIDCWVNVDNGFVREKFLYGNAQRVFFARLDGATA
jgi:hypothetical protein